MIRYALLHNDGNCVGVCEYPQEMYSESLILLKPDENVIGMKYINGEWVENVIEPVIDEPTQLDKIEANLDYLVLLNS